MQSYQPELIRNIVLLSHGGAGKTSLSEAMLFNTGVINRMGRVDDGTTTSDWDPDEQKRKISTSTSLLPLEWKGAKINLLDAPGYADFVGEMKAAARVADAACIVVCAASGVEVGTELVWQYADEAGLPRMAFVNKMDRENADFARTLEQMQRSLGSKCVALQLPIGAQASFKGVVDIIDQKAFLGIEGTEAPVPTELQDDVASHREKLIEAVAETDDELLTKYLEGETLTQEELWRGLRTAVASGAVVPVLAGSALQNAGVRRYMDSLLAVAPSPVARGAVKVRNTQTNQEEELSADPQGPLAAFVFKSTADPYLGKLTYFRVFSGALRSDLQVWNANKGKQERVGQLLLVRGKTQEPTQQVGAGDLGAVAKLTETTTSDTLTAREHPVTIAPISFPPPLYSAAVHPRTKVDLDKMGPALARLVEEDPTLHVHRDTDTSETILSGIGESHVEIAVEKMKRKFGVDVVIGTPKVSYKETISMPVKSEYKHKKQTGGHGQYGHVFLELQPLSRGSGFEFAEKVVGGVVPRNYIPAVEKGVHSAIQEGVLARFPVVDLKVTLFDGSYHPVDSSDIAFQIAAAQAFKLGVQKGQPVLLEPIVSLKVTVPEGLTGDVMSDLNTRRAKVLGMTPHDGQSTVEALAPQAEVQHYAADIRSITQGRGTFTTELSHYEEVPAHLAQKIIEQAKKEREAAEKAS
ncbi:MAG: elongation factor G [Chloroflexi bacterium]|nr:elongation factor G [Chloroflexota bacterium]